MSSTNGYLYIDGTKYNVHLIDVKRTGDMLDAQAYRTEDGILHRKVIGMYYNYEVTVGIEEDLDLYDKLFNKLTEPVASHSVQLPGEDAPQSRYISSVSDGILRVTKKGTLYKDLTFKAICTSPSRRSSKKA